MNTIKNRHVTLVFYFSILIFIIRFQFSHTMVGNWYRQFMSNIGGKQISDVFCLNSLTGGAAQIEDSIN